MKTIIATALVAAPPAVEILPLSEEIATEYKLDREFYEKVTEVQGIVIATSGRVADHTHKKTAYQFDNVMKALKPDIAQRIPDNKVLCIIVAHDELTSDVPLFDALVRAFPGQSAELIRAFLDSGDVTVNGEATNAEVKITGKDEVLIVFGGEKQCYAIKNQTEYFADGVQA